MVVARAFGAGPVTDAFFVAFRIPNILRRLLAEGALSTAMIPVFTDYMAREDRPELHRMLRAVLGLSLLALTVTTVLGILFAPAILQAIAPGFMNDPAQASLAVSLTRIMFPYLILVGLAAMATGVLNSQGRFFASAIGPAVLNVGMIVAVVLLPRYLDQPIVSLAIGVLAGGVGQLVVQVPATVGLVALRTPIVRVLFERGRFGPAETAATAEALAWYAVGLAGFAGSRIVAQTFYARSEAATAVRWGIVSIVANVVAALALMGPLGHAGLAGAASVGAYVNLLALLVIARLRLGRLGGRALVDGAARTLLASAPLAALCWLALAWWPPHPSFVVDAAWLAATIAAGTGAFWAASAALGISERTALLGLARRRERDAAL